MQLHLQDLHDWTTLNNMKINYAKNKEMIQGPLAKCPPDLLSATGKKRMCGSADVAMGNAVIKL